MRILIVEDDDSIRVSLAEILKEEGYHIDTAQDGYVALEYLRNHPAQLPHLIICDIAMPVMNGFEFREAQLREEEVCKIPLLCVSAMHWSDWMKDKLAADGYLAKPMSLERLAEMVARFDPRNSGVPAHHAHHDETKKTKTIR